MNILICDDEIGYVEDVKHHVLLFMRERSVECNFYEFTDGQKVLESSIKYDLAFLDIEIGNISGIDIAKHLRSKNKSTVIFVITAYEKYLDDALDLNILRFLSKPLCADRLYKGLEKALELIDSTLIGFYLKSNDDYIQVPAGSIIFVEIENRHTNVVTEERIYCSKENIDYWKEALIPSYFYQVHNSYIINMNFISSYNRDIVILCRTHRIPVSYRRQPEFKKAFMRFMESR